jgi:hypothetical protein
MNKSKKKARKIPPKEKAQKKESAVEKETTDSSAKFLIYFFVFLIVVFGGIIALRYFYNNAAAPEVQSYSYNGFVFTNVTGLWYVEMQKAGGDIIYNVPLHFSPQQLIGVPMNGDVNKFNAYRQIYLTFDPTGEELGYVALAASELSINLAQTLSITPIAACTKNMTDACASRPIVDCNSSMPAIFLNPYGSANISVNENCIKLDGAGADLVKSADRLLLTLFGVMD